MISFSRANHHRLPQLFLPLPTGPTEGKVKNALFRFRPRPCPALQMGNVGPNRSWTPGLLCRDRPQINRSSLFVTLAPAAEK